MKIAHLARAVYPQSGTGGLERHVYHLTRHLLLLGHEVELFVQASANLPPDFGPGCAGAPLKLHYLPYSRLPLRRNSVADRVTNYPLFARAMGREVAALVAAGGAEVVHAHGLCAEGYAAARHGLRVPLVMNPHGLEDFKVRDWRKWLAYAPFRALYRRGAQAAQRVIATDMAMVEEVRDYLHLPARRVVVLPNAVDEEEATARLDPAIQAALRQRLALDGQFVLLSVGRVEANKGFDGLLKALHLARRELPAEWRWLLVGSGGELARLETIVQVLGLASHVSFLGALPDAELSNLYPLADLFVHPTLYEGSALVVMEAMLHGLPVVATNVGGIPDKVRERETGWLVAPDDIEGLARAIMAAASSLARHEMGAAGRRLMLERYTWPAVARQTVALYAELLAA